MPRDAFYIGGPFLQVHQGKKPGRKVNTGIAVVVSDIYLWLLLEIKTQKHKLRSNNDLKQEAKPRKKNKHGSVYMHDELVKTLLQWQLSFRMQHSSSSIGSVRQKRCPACNLTPSVKVLRCCAAFIGGR